MKCWEQKGHERFAKAGKKSVRTSKSTWSVFWPVKSGPAPQLDRKIKSLCTISALAALGRNRALELNIRMAHRNGATREELLETLLHIAPYAGFPAAWEAIALVDEVYKELE
ncbi:carboxymuconolactone decarboxylase family protein [Acidobacteria bacterium AH-259-A15]|nr:carboxymuconolactone decarboxylase family protein [Acidobacteria bacterium AH-259-A15]